MIRDRGEFRFRRRDRATDSGWFCLSSPPISLGRVVRLPDRAQGRQSVFFAGNRRSPWFVVAFAIIGSSISGVTFASVPGWVEISHFSYPQTVMGFVAGQFADEIGYRPEQDMQHDRDGLDDPSGAHQGQPHGQYAAD